MKKFTILSMVLGLGIFLASCGGGSTEQTQETTQQNEPVEQQIQQDEPSVLEAQLANGEKIYNEKCIICHQADAMGVKGAFPPLANADYLLADLKRAVAQTLNGSNEEMVVNGETYSAPMTPQVTTKEDAVAVINYVLTHFNGYSEDKLVTMDDVADVEIKPVQL